MTDDAFSGMGTQNLDLTLLANFVHQVVNPLNGVAGTLDNLIDGTIEENRREQRTTAARAQLERCITLVRNLAFLVGDPTAPLGPDRRTVVLPQVIIESAMFFQEEGATRRIRIHLQDRQTQNKVSGHPELIRQVLMNLFDNAVKYARVGSEVAVNQWVQSNTNDAIITVRSVPEIGIAAGEMEKIFDLGFRGSNAKTIVASGTGIGLYVCRQLVEAKHGGRIACQNDGDGLLFTIKLPGGTAG
jgi:signal transduction histidine kinase